MPRNRIEKGKNSESTANPTEKLAGRRIVPETITIPFPRKVRDPKRLDRLEIKEIKRKARAAEEAAAEKTIDILKSVKIKNIAIALAAKAK